MALCKRFGLGQRTLLSYRFVARRAARHRSMAFMQPLMNRDQNQFQQIQPWSRGGLNEWTSSASHLHNSPLSVCVLSAELMVA
jgi:hypothetical protein